MPQVIKGVVEGLNPSVVCVAKPRLDSHARFFPVTFHQTQCVLNDSIAVRKMSCGDFTFNKFIKVL